MNGNTNEKVDITLADMDLVDMTYDKISKITPDKMFVLYNNLTGKTKTYSKGLLLRLPGLHTLYTIGAGTYDVKVMNPENTKGRYEQNVGIGDDIELSLKIRFRIVKNSEGASKFLRQQGTWKNAVKTVSENIMQNVIEIKREDIAQKCREARYSEIKLPNINVSDFVKNINNPELDDLGRTIALESLRLKDDYGIDLLKVGFVDIDVSERIKNAKVASIEAENQRKIREADAKTQREIELANSKNQLLIAKNKGLAKALENEEIIKSLKKEGYTISDIKQLIELLSLPEDANVIYGANDNISVPIMTNPNGRTK